jgi:UPF0271 protein
VLFALAGSELVKAGRSVGLIVAEEVFADRTYQADGSLTPRTHPGAMIQREDEAVAQIFDLLEGKVRTIEGQEIAIRADTVCLHGDGAHAVAFARRINSELREARVVIKAFDPK